MAGITKCLCVDCSVIPDYRYTEQFRHLTEVDMVIRMKTREERSQYLSGVETKRGKAAADRLKADILKGWRKDGK